jgi:signal peptidase I
MEPTLRCKAGLPGCSGKQDDRLEVVEKFRIRRGDIVVFETPQLARQVCGAGGKYVKRVIGLPGEVVAERSGRVFINGRRLAEPYIRPGRRDSETHPPQRIPRGRYYLLGDNRTASCDSRIWGTVRRAGVIAKVVAVQRGDRRIPVR